VIGRMDRQCTMCSASITAAVGGGLTIVKTDEDRISAEEVNVHQSRRTALTDRLEGVGDSLPLALNESQHQKVTNPLSS
jgi:tRNA(Arg) A34 adenosine deaminase TadA